MTSIDEAIKGRVLRGIRLFEDRGGEIQPLDHGHYSVPGCVEGAYEVDLGIFSGLQTCECPDFEINQIATCKHLTAAELYRCKVQRPRWKHQQAERAQHDLVAGLA